MGHQRRFGAQCISQLLQRLDDVRVMFVAVAREQARGQVERQALVVGELDRVERSAMVKDVATTIFDEAGATLLKQVEVALDGIGRDTKLSCQFASRPPRWSLGKF